MTDEHNLAQTFKVEFIYTEFLTLRHATKLLH